MSDTENADELIEKLVNINLDLEERNKQLVAANEEYKSINLCNEEIISEMNAKNIDLETEIEKCLQARDEYKSMNEYNEQIIEEYGRKITELEEHIRKLNQDISEIESINQCSDDLISDLAAKNLNLEEENRKLTNAISEYESINQCNEEIIDSMKEMEKELNSRIEKEHINGSVLRQQIGHFETKIEQYESIIQKLRQRIADLNHEIQTQSDEITEMKLAETQRLSENPEAQSFSLFAKNVNRSFGEIVDAELRAIDLESAQQQAAYLKAFLPDNFAKNGGDWDCLQLCLLFPRLSAKSLLLIRLLELKFPQSQGGLRREHVTLSHKAEQWAHVKQFCYMLRKLHTTSEKILSALKSCSVDRLLKVAIRQPEIESQTRLLDQYFELIRQNRFDENTSSEWLERINTFLQKLFDANLSADEFNVRDDLSNKIRQIKDAVEWAKFSFARLKFFLKPDTQPPLISTLDEFIAGLVECENLAVRSQNRIPKKNELTIPDEFAANLVNSIAELEKVVGIGNQTCMLAMSQLLALDVEGLSPDQLEDYICSAAEKFFGAVDIERVKTTIRTKLTTLQQFLSELNERLENSSMEIPPNEKEGFPPLIERANMRRNDVVEAENLRWQLKKKEEEALKLQKLVKLRDDDIGTLRLRLDMADKASKPDKISDEKSHQLKARCTELEERVHSQEIAIQELRADLDKSEQDREKEKERTREFSKRALFANITHNLNAASATQFSSVAIPTIQSSIQAASGAGGGGKIDECDPEAQLKSVETMLNFALNDLNWAQRRIRLLENRQISGLLENLDEIHPPNTLSGVYSLKYRRNEKALVKLQQLQREAEHINNMLSEMMLEPVNRGKRQTYHQKLAAASLKTNVLEEAVRKMLRDSNLSIQHVNIQPPVETAKVPAEPQTCRSILAKWKESISKREKIQ